MTEESQARNLQPSNVKLNFISINQLNPYSLENSGLNKRPKIDEFKLFKQFVNHEFVQIKNEYANSSKLNEYKWKLIIKYVIKTTHDFDFARLIKNDHEQLFNFFQRYYNLKTIDVKNVKVSKEERESIINSDNYKDFEEYFSHKIELIKIISHMQQLNDYIYFKQVSKDKLRKMLKMEQDMNLLEIPHLEYEIYYENAQYSNLRTLNISRNQKFHSDFGNENSEMIQNEMTLGLPIESPILNKIDTMILVFLIINNIVDIRNLTLNRDGDIIVLTTYYSFSLSLISSAKSGGSRAVAASEKVFEQIQFYQKLLKLALSRDNIIDCIDKYLELNLTGSQLQELENLKKLKMD